MFKKSYNEKVQVLVIQKIESVDEFSTIRYDHSSTSKCTFCTKMKKENVFQSQSMGRSFYK